MIGEMRKFPMIQAMTKRRKNTKPAHSANLKNWMATSNSFWVENMIGRGMQFLVSLAR